MKPEIEVHILSEENLVEISEKIGWDRIRLERMLARANSRNEVCIVRVPVDG